MTTYVGHLICINRVSSACFHNFTMSSIIFTSFTEGESYADKYLFDDLLDLLEEMSIKRALEEDAFIIKVFF